MHADLILPMKGEYFDAIKSGHKLEEYRLDNEFWRKRLEGRTFARVILTKGYPRRDDHERRLVLPWRGYRRTTITHPHFGPDPIAVFAIDVSSRAQMALSEAQIEALSFAASAQGGWPRAKANERSWVIRSYRALERRGFVEEIEADAKVVGPDLRLHFIATEAGRRALKEQADA